MFDLRFVYLLFETIVMNYSSSSLAAYDANVAVGLPLFRLPNDGVYVIKFLIRDLSSFLYFWMKLFCLDWIIS